MEEGSSSQERKSVRLFSFLFIIVGTSTDWTCLDSCSSGGMPGVLMSVTVGRGKRGWARARRILLSPPGHVPQTVFLKDGV